MVNVVIKQVRNANHFYINFDLLNFNSELAYDELDQALYSLLSSVALLAFMLFLGPLIFLFNRNIALLGEVRLLYH